jgi:hypothetical protein
LVVTVVVAQAVDAGLLTAVALRVARIAALVAAGVFLANLTVELGAVERVAALSQHLTGPANLPDEAGTAIVTTAASTTAGYGMLADFRESGRLSDRETLVAVTINTFFGFVQHIFTFYAPVLIPILGLEVGMLYVGSRALIALGITLAGLVGGAILLSSPDESTDASRSSPDPTTDGGALDDDAPDSLHAAARGAWASTRSTLRRIVPRLAVVYAAVTVLIAVVDLRAATAAADPVAALLGLPGAAVPVVVVFAFDTTAGAAAIAPLVGEPFTPRTAVATMLVGGLVSLGVSTFKRSIPFQYGIWGPSFGSKVVALNTSLKIVFIGAALVVLLGT